MKTLVLLVILAGCFESNVVGDDSIDIGDADPTATHPGAVPRPGGPGSTPSLPAGSPYRPGDRVDLGGADVVIVGPEGSEAAQQVAMPGDMDGDGLAEVVIATHRWTGRASPDRHAVSILYGRADLGSTISLPDADATFVTWPVNYSGGDSVMIAGAGDVNDDGLSDLLVGLPGLFGDFGRVYLIYGSAARPRAERLFEDLEVSLTDEVVAGRFGKRIAGVGDVDGDGFDDFVVASGNTDVPGSFRVDLFYGSGTRLGADARPAASLLGADDELIGGAVGEVGDADGDGLDDFAVLSGLFSGGERAYLVRGSSARLSGSVRIPDVGVPFETPESPGGFGFVGDLDEDGLDDFGLRAGRTDAASVFYGGAARWHDAFSFEDAETTYVAPSPENWGGMARGGDVNGDGHADLLIGDGRAGDGRGAVYLVYGDGTRRVGPVDLATDAVAFLGRETPESFDPMTGIHATMVHDLAGVMIAGGHDIDGDGLDDFVVGAPGNGSSGGRAYIVYGIAGP